MDMSTNLVQFFGDPGSISDVCDALMDGKLLTEFCRENGLRYCDVARWIASSDDRQEAYDRALQLSGDRLAFEALAIADDPDEPIQHKRVRISTRLQVAARWFPARYGERTAPVSAPIEGSYTIEYGLPAPDPEPAQ